MLIQPVPIKLRSHNPRKQFSPHAPPPRDGPYPLLVYFSLYCYSTFTLFPFVEVSVIKCSVPRFIVIGEVLPRADSPISYNLDAFGFVCGYSC